MNGWDRFRRLPLAARVLAVVFAVLLVLELAGSLVAPLGGGDGGPSPSSASSTAPSGLAAYAELLARAGHRVTLEGSPLDEAASLDAGATLVVAGTTLTEDEVDAAAEFLAHGGRLVAAGSEVAGALRRLVDGNVRWRGDPPDDARTVAAVPETAGVRGLFGADAAWEDVGGALPVVAGPVVAVADVGAGRVVLVADPGVFENAQLDTGDNAAFALAAAGGRARPVVFAEGGHQRSRGTGLAAIPGRWRGTLMAVGLAAVLAMWSAGRRFGPPEEDERELPPPRRAYVDALAATLARSRQPEEAVAPLRQAARERLARRAGLPPDAGDAALRRAAGDAGLAPTEIEALFAPVAGDERAMDVARAMARLGGSAW